MSTTTDTLSAELNSDDHTHDAVPLSERRSGLTMGLLWITMVTCFPGILVGFQWSKAGFNFQQVVQGLLLSCSLVLLYALPACYLGAKTGLTYTLLSRFVFGRWGARFVTLNILWVSTCWYALNAIFLADGIRGLFHLQISELAFAAGIALLMAVNNFFGFSGVANFAQFLAAPLMIVWVCLAFYRVVSMSGSLSLDEAPTAVAGLQYISVISNFVLGVSCWGNEPDYWRYAKPHRLAALWPLLSSLALGQILFPLTGFMMAKLSGITGNAEATRYVSDFVFGGAAVAFAIVLAVSYVAVNDSGLYAAVNALENLKKIPRKLCVSVLAIAAAILTSLLFGYGRNFELVASLSSIFLPCATMIMATEAFVIKRICGKSEQFEHIPEYDELPSFKWASATALILGCAVGVCTAGFFPALAKLQFGVPALNAWLVSISSYCILRPLEIKQGGKAVYAASQNRNEDLSLQAQQATFD